MTSNLPTLPAGWELKKIANVSKFVRGITFKPTDKYETLNEKSIPCFRTSNVQTKLDDSDLIYIDKTLVKDKEKIIQHGDILVSSANSLELLGKCCLIENLAYEATLGGFIVCVRVDRTIVDYKYFYYFFNSDDNQEIMRSLANKTTGIANLPIKKVEEQTIPLPPLDEQKRLVSLLDTLFAKIDRSLELLNENITAADALLPSALNTVFGELEEKWEIVPVGQVTNCIVPQRNKPKEFIGDIPWITTDDLVLFKHISKSTKGLGLTRNSIKEVQSKTIPAESVLMSCVGDLGIVAISDKEIVVNQQLHTFQCHESLLNTYLQYALYVKKDFMYQIANITTVAYMNKAKCNSIPIPLPPIDIQIQSVEYLDSIRDKVEILKHVQNNKIAHLKALKASILDRAFKGEL